MPHANRLFTAALAEARLGQEAEREDADIFDAMGCAMARLGLLFADLFYHLYKKVSVSPSSGPVPPPGIRNCCMLAKTMLDTSIIVEPVPDSYRHFYGAGGLVPEDVVGQMYTIGGGFIDFGHLRDIGDLTKYYYDVLLLSGRQGDVIKPPVADIRGTVTLLHNVPADRHIDVARSIAYAEAVFHEIETYWDLRWGRHHSSFSPEDLVSNFFGTVVAGNAIRLGLSGSFGDYNTLFAGALGVEMKLLGALGTADTSEALDCVDGTWFKGDSVKDGYLRRRNFSVWPLRPWLVDGIGTTGTGSFPSSTTSEFAIPDDASGFYVARYDVDKHSQGPDKIDAGVVVGSDFASLIESIRAAALSEYGDEYDSPVPVGRVGP